MDAAPDQKLFGLELSRVLHSAKYRCWGSRRCDGGQSLANITNFVSAVCLLMNS